MNKNSLSVFNKAPYPWYRVIKRIKYHCGTLKCAWQRATRGYSYRDLWSLDTFYSWLFVNSLEDFSKGLNGAPNDYFDYNADTADEQLKPWLDYLAEMRNHFYNSIEGNEPEENEYTEPLVNSRLMNGHVVDSKEPLVDKWLKREEELASWRAEELDKGFEMLRKVYWSLWD